MTTETDTVEEEVMTTHKAATSTGTKIHLAYKNTGLVARLGRPAGFTTSGLYCGTAITYRFTIAAHEITDDERGQITCTKCLPYA